MPSSRDDTLRALLPPKESDYSFERLSEAETIALEAAFCDGFGEVTAPGYRPRPIPTSLESGLIRHSFYIRDDSEYDQEDFTDEFWDSGDDDQPPPSDFCPLHFNLRRLGLYFKNQLDRFCEQAIKRYTDPAPSRWILEEDAASRLYKKPWYEFHAVLQMDLIERLALVGQHRGNALPNRGHALLISSSAGTLGRLIEQYYWRLRFEKAARTGIGARAGASLGGKSKAKLGQAEHSRWQKVAAEVWAKNSDLTKTAVANAIRKRLGTPQTAKHIARFIKRP